MKKIRVIHVVYSFRTGGMERGIATVVRNASEMFDHIIICLSSSGETERQLPPDTRVIELHKPPGNSPSFLLKLARTLRSLKPVIVHTRNWGGIDGVIASRIAGIPFVIQGEHGWAMDDPDGLNSTRVKVRHFLCRWIREFTCVSQHLQRWLLETVKVKKPITQIYNGVDTQVFCPGNGGCKIRSELGIAENAFVAGIIGRLDPIKDHPTLFRAFAELKDVPDARLLVVGDGPEYPHLQSLADHRIIFLGNQTNIPDILQALDVFVLPSLNEGISNTILEAMATEIPVIATRVGGNTELVEDGSSGILVPAGDSMAIATALLSYLKNPGLRESHGKFGRKRVIQFFKVEDMVKKYETVYRRVVSKGEIGIAGGLSSQQH